MEISRKQARRIFSAGVLWSKNESKIFFDDIWNIIESENEEKEGIPDGYVEVYGKDCAEGYSTICKLEDWNDLISELKSEHPGVSGYLNFRKYLYYKLNGNEYKLFR